MTEKCLAEEFHGSFLPYSLKVFLKVIASVSQPTAAGEVILRKLRDCFGRKRLAMIYIPTRNEHTMIINRVFLLPISCHCLC